MPRCCVRSFRFTPVDAHAHNIPHPHHNPNHPHSLSRELTHLEAEIFIADYMQAEAVHNVIDSYSKEFPTGLKILDGVVDTAMALKQQVPVDYDMLATHCAEDVGTLFDVAWCVRMIQGDRFTSIHLYPPTPAPASSHTEAFCPGLGPDETRDCLNQEFDSRVLSHECLKVILPRGALDLQIPNLARFGEQRLTWYACMY